MSFCVNRIVNEGGAARWHLDLPSAAMVGASVPHYYLELAGWVALSAGAAQAVAVYAPLLHRAPLQIIALHPRDDVAGALNLPPETPTGFRGVVSLLGLRDARTLELAVVSSARWAAFSRDSRYLSQNFERLARLDLSIDDGGAALVGPAPLFVTSIGRSGSTALIGALAAHPSVLAPRHYPYESKMLQFAQHLLTLIVSPRADGAGLTAQQFMDHPYLATANPFIDRNDYPEIFSAFNQGALGFIAPLLRQAISQLIALHAARPADVRFLAEKLVPNTRMATLAEAIWADATEIILLRDFDPWFQSAQGFSEASGRYFGRDATPGIVLDQAIQEYGALLDYAERRIGRAMIVSFEALVGSAETLHAICTHLGLEMNAAMATALRTVPAGHATIRPGQLVAPPAIAEPFAARRRRLLDR